MNETKSGLYHCPTETPYCYRANTDALADGVTVYDTTCENHIGGGTPRIIQGDNPSNRLIHGTGKCGCNFFIF